MIVRMITPLRLAGSGQWMVSFVVTHEADPSDPSIPARSYPLAFAADTWSGTITIGPEAGTKFGHSGRYLLVDGRSHICEVSRKGSKGTEDAVFEVTFEMEIDSQTETDPLTATVYSVTGGRAPAKVTVENGGAKYTKQRAHVTANHVHIAAMERLITGETWFGAWEAMRGAWQFSRAILDEWYADDKLGSGVNQGIRQNLYALLGSADDIVSDRLSRNNIPLQTCWFVRPLQGTDDEKSKGRHYFDHDPQPTDYDTTRYGPPQRWVPNLGTEYVAALGQNLTDWVDCRGQFPWTSVDTDSFRTGEASAVTKLDKLVGEREGDGVLSHADQKLMAGYMLVTYDFFPPTLTKARTLYHAAGTAARHVVEYYYYCPDIEEAWRDSLAVAFLAEWKAWVERTVAEPPPNRNTDGLTALLQSWTDVTDAYNQYYASFKTTLP